MNIITNIVLEFMRTGNRDKFKNKIKILLGNITLDEENEEYLEKFLNNAELMRKKKNILDIEYGLQEIVSVLNLNKNSN